MNKETYTQFDEKIKELRNEYSGKILVGVYPIITKKNIKGHASKLEKLGQKWKAQGGNYNINLTKSSDFERGFIFFKPISLPTQFIICGSQEYSDLLSQKYNENGGSYGKGYGMFISQEII
jgi:hypothetical protein